MAVNQHFLSILQANGKAAKAWAVPRKFGHSGKEEKGLQDDLSNALEDWSIARAEDPFAGTNYVSKVSVWESSGPEQVNSEKTC